MQIIGNLGLNLQNKPIEKKNKFFNTKNISDVFVRSSRINKISFGKNFESNALTSRLKERPIAEPGEIKKMVNEYPEEDQFVGSFPKEWFDTGTDKQAAIEAFKDAGWLLRLTVDGEDRISAETEEKLRKAGFKGDFKGFKYLDQGDFARAFKFEINDKEYVMKVFKNKRCPDVDPPRNIKELNEENKPALHGLYPEVNRALYWTNYEPHQYAKFHFADFDSGFMVVDFIPENAAEPRRTVDPLSVGLLPTDDDPHTETKTNGVNGNFYEYGGQMVIR